MSAAAALAAITVGLAVLLAGRGPSRSVPGPGMLPWVLAGGLTLALLTVSGLPLLPVAVLAAAAGAGWLLHRRQRRRRGAVANAAQVQAFCDELASGLAAGVPVGAALAAAVGPWPALGQLARTHELGGSVPEALRRVARLPGAGDLDLVAAAWSVAHRSGGSLSVALDQVAGAVRERQRTRRLVASELASARATARLMAGLPVFTLVMGSGTGGDPIAFLLTTTPGLVCLAAGLLLALLGLAWVEAIATSVEATL